MDETIKIHVMHCGQIQVDSALPFRQKSLNPLAFTGWMRPKTHQVLLPVCVFLIEHPRGLILVDTGWHTDVRGDQKKYLGRIHHQVYKAVLPEGQAVHEQLRERKIQPADIDHVILTHLHSDHVSGLKLVSDAQNILTSQEEWKAAKHDRLHYLPHLWSEVNMWTFHTTPSIHGPRRRAMDFFGDKSIHLIHLPGHTSGLVAVHIQHGRRFVLLVSDCAYAARSWKQLALPGMMANKTDLLDSLRWVRLMSQTTGCMEVLCSHDPHVTPHTIEI